MSGCSVREVTARDSRAFPPELLKLPFRNRCILALKDSSRYNFLIQEPVIRRCFTIADSWRTREIPGLYPNKFILPRAFRAARKEREIQ